jgi:hypothetical protein
MRKKAKNILIGCMIISPLIGAAIFSSVKFSAASSNITIPPVVKIDEKKAAESPKESWNKEWEIAHKSIPASPTDEQPTPAF